MEHIKDRGIGGCPEGYTEGNTEYEHDTHTCAHTHAYNRTDRTVSLIGCGRHSEKQGLK